MAIADTGGFTQAAGVVGRTQSAVSMQIKKLEAFVGQPLFLRAKRGVSLTAPGETLLTSARRVLRLLDEAAAALRPAPVEGAVCVGLPEEYGATVLPAVLARFADNHPAVRVTVRCEPSLTLNAALDGGELDLAVVVSDLGADHGELLFHDPTVWVTSARHLAHESEPLPLAMFEAGCWWRDWVMKSLDEQGRAYRIAYSSAGIAGIQAAIAAGLAVGVLGRSTMPPGSRLLGVAEGFANLPGSNVLLRRRAGATSPATDSMAAAITRSFRLAPADGP